MLFLAKKAIAQAPYILPRISSFLIHIQHTHTCAYLHTQWSIFLQERVVSEIYSMALSERNQQALCQVIKLKTTICTAVNVYVG